VAQGGAGERRGERVELGAGLAPVERVGVEALVGALRGAEHGAVGEFHLQFGGHLVGEARGQLRVGGDPHPVQQVLHVVGGDALRCVLLGGDPAVQQGGGEHVGQRV